MANKEIETVEVLPGCISCGACEATCPEVFSVEGVSCVKDKADVKKHLACIEEASEMCPVGVIKISWKNEY